MKVAVVGLPLYTKRMSESLNSFAGKKIFYPFDTYYSKKDQLAFLLKVRSMDAIFSINGEVAQSKVFDIAIKRNIPLIVMWVGTDVIKALNHFKKGNFQKKYINYPTHICDGPSLGKELKEMGINAPFLNFQSLQVDSPPVAFKELKILSRIGKGRESFYGMDRIIELAKQFTDVSFTVVGTDGYPEHNIPDNIECIEWTDKMSEMFRSHALSLRLPEHDGLSPFVLEALSFGNYVCYTNELPHTIHTPEVEQVATVIKKLQTELANDGEISPNVSGYEYIKNEYPPQKVNQIMLNFIQDIIKK